MLVLGRQHSGGVSDAASVLSLKFERLPSALLSGMDAPYWLRTLFFFDGD
jgi:hypothetical protein